VFVRLLGGRRMVVVFLIGARLHQLGSERVMGERLGDRVMWIDEKGWGRGG